MKRASKVPGALNDNDERFGAALLPRRAELAREGLEALELARSDSELRAAEAGEKVLVRDFRHLELGAVEVEKRRAAMAARRADGVRLDGRADKVHRAARAGRVLERRHPHRCGSARRPAHGSKEFGRAALAQRFHESLAHNDGNV